MASGNELRILRVASELKVKEVAEAMGVSRATMWTIERRATVPSAQAERYRDAVARLSAEKAA